jgi:hypothetical protein
MVGQFRRMVELLVEGMIRYASSAYLKYLLVGYRGERSDELTLNRIGPNTDPWTTLELMEAEFEKELPSLVQWVRSLRYWRIQL